MKKIFVLMTFIEILLSSQAQARFYHCRFTEPFFTILISTNNKLISITSIYTSSKEFYGSPPYSSSRIEGKNLVINDNITIVHNEEGSDGMSSFYYPFLAKYKDSESRTHFGGCTTETVDFGREILRTRSLDDVHGLSIVDYWPGEFSSLRGYKSNKEIQIPGNTNYSSLDLDPELDPKSCTIKSGKYFVPFKKIKGEKYANLSHVSKYKVLKDQDITEFIIKDNKYVGTKIIETLKKDDFVLELNPTAEGNCFIQYGEKNLDSFCPSNDPNGYTLVDHQNNPIEKPKLSPLLGDSVSQNFVYTQCKEGHWTWISEENVLKKRTSDFEAVEMDF